MLCDTTRPFVELSAGETPVPNFHQYGATANGEPVFVLLEHRSISGMCRAQHYVAETGLNAAHSCQNNSKALALVVTSCASLLSNTTPALDPVLVLFENQPKMALDD